MKKIISILVFASYVIAQPILVSQNKMFRIELDSQNTKLFRLKANDELSGVWAIANVGVDIDLKLDTPNASVYDIYTLELAGYDSRYDFESGRILSGFLLSGGLLSHSQPQSSAFIKSIGAGVYASYLHNSGYYIDSSVKYSTLFSDITTKAYDVPANNDMWILSINVGRKIEFSKEIFIQGDIGIGGGYLLDSKFKYTDEYGNKMIAINKPSTPLGVKLSIATGKKFQSSEVTAKITAIRDINYNDEILIQSPLGTSSFHLPSKTRLTLGLGYNARLTQKIFFYSYMDLGGLDLSFLGGIGLKINFGDTKAKPRPIKSDDNPKYWQKDDSFNLPKDLL